MSNSISISLIAAIARNNAIGRNGDLLWKLKEDLQRFKLLTIGKPVIMGRKTWLSLGRPLPERLNIVMTNDTNFTASGAVVVHSYSDAIAHATAAAISGFGEIMIIGGGSIYAEALPTATKLYLTEVDDAPADADAFFPAFNRNEWEVVQNLRREGPPPFSFVDYVRKA